MSEAEATGVDGEAFWRELLDHIVTKLRHVPKFQVERAVGPMLDYFITKDPTFLGGDMEILATEFPLKKKGTTLQSTNVDWLLYDRCRNELVLLELKTDDGSFSSGQLERYLELLESGVGAGQGICSRLQADLKEIQGGSKGADYSAAASALIGVMQRLGDPVNMGIRVLYLAPRAICPQFRCHLRRFRRARSGSPVFLRVGFRSFGWIRRNLPSGSEEGYSRYRALLCDALCALDEKRKANASADPSDRQNYQGKAFLEEMLARCRSDESIVVGFDGGRRALEQVPLGVLEQRQFKWDRADKDRKGVKDNRHWMEGSSFVESIEKVRSRLQKEKSERELLADFERALQDNRGLLVRAMKSRAWPGNRPSLENMTAREFLQTLVQSCIVDDGNDSPDDRS